MKISRTLFDDLRTAEAATYDNGGDFGFSSEMYDCPIKGQQVLKKLEALGLVSVDWNTKINGKRINDDQFEMTEEGHAVLEEACRPAVPVRPAVRHEAFLAKKVAVVRCEVFEFREHGDERMRQVQDLLAQAQALLEQAAMGK
tara:strand:- start:6703 stop:7131 length:429 start_codon:yes stop_codon:yes gene_type:complete